MYFVVVNIAHLVYFYVKSSYMGGMMRVDDDGDNAR